MPCCWCSRPTSTIPPTTSATTTSSSPSWKKNADAGSSAFPLVARRDDGCGLVVREKRMHRQRNLAACEAARVLELAVDLDEPVDGHRGLLRDHARIVDAGLDAAARKMRDERLAPRRWQEHRKQVPARIRVRIDAKQVD